jgi:hypothetical protein
VSDPESKRLQADLAANRIQVAPMPRDAYLVPEFVQEFSRRVLGCEWADIGATEFSSALDFTDASRWLIVARIRNNYGVDVDDIPDLNLWEVLRRCSG